MSDATMDAVFIVFLFGAIICGTIAVLGYLTEVLPGQIQRIHRRRRRLNKNEPAKRSGRYRERPYMHGHSKGATADAISNVLPAIKTDDSLPKV